MNQTPDRIPCPACKAENFPSSAVCWQCGKPLQVRQDQPPPTESPIQPPSQPQPQFAPIQPPPPSYQPPPYPTRQAADNTKSLVIWGFVCGALGLVCCPFISIVGLIFGIVVMRRGNSVGIGIIILSVLTLTIGLVLATLLPSMMKGFMQGFNTGLQQANPQPPRTL